MRIKYCDEILKKIERGMAVSPAAFKIGEAAVLGMLFEISSSPSPGLVSPFSRGSHSDMDYFTFLRSTCSIAYSMYICAQIGMDYDDDILDKLRSAGFDAERRMMASTGGVNTQKGLLFLAGVVCAAAGRCVKYKKELNRENISKECSFICKGIVDRELGNLNNTEKLTGGEKIFIKYGISGVRGEIEKGLPSVLKTGLPMYDDALSGGLSENEALCHSLTGLMAVVDDTTVINRRGTEGLNLMKCEAQKAVGLGGMKTQWGREYIKHMDCLFVENNISPGGCADLLAVTVMIHKLEQDTAFKNY